MSIAYSPLWYINCVFLQRLVMHMQCWATQTKGGSMTWQEGRSRAARVTHTEEALTSTGALRLTLLLRTSSTCSLEVASPPVSEHLCAYRFKHTRFKVTDKLTWLLNTQILCFIIKMYWFYSYITVMIYLINLVVNDFVSQKYNHVI